MSLTGYVACFRRYYRLNYDGKYWDKGLCRAKITWDVERRVSNWIRIINRIAVQIIVSFIRRQWKVWSRERFIVLRDEESSGWIIMVESWIRDLVMQNEEWNR